MGVASLSRGILSAVGLVAALVVWPVQGCGSYPLAPATGTATITLKPGLSGAIRYAVKANAEGYGPQDVTRIALALYTVDGTTVMPVIRDAGMETEHAFVVNVWNTGADFADATVSFANLRRGTTYRIVAQAFGTGPAGAEVRLSADSGCQNDVRVGEHDQEVVTDLAGNSPIVVPVALKPRVVTARQTSEGVVITPGTASPVPFTP
jgi:hypothetical protein